MSAYPNGQVKGHGRDNSLPAAFSALSLSGKVALITGATSGIGAASAQLFAARGAKVVIVGRREVEGNAVVASIVAEGGVAVFFKADISVETEAAAAVRATVAKFGRLDIAFNNAAMAGGFKPSHEVLSQDFNTLMNVNLNGVFFCMKYEVEQFLAQQQGQDKPKFVDVTTLDHSIQPNNYYLNSHPYVIINTSSILGRKGWAGASAYSTSKHALEGLTKTAALDYAKRGIRVVAIDSGAVYTDMSKGMPIDLFIKGIPMGRIGQAQEIAELAAFLASNAASYITGTGIVADGGNIA